ncbi:Carboxy-terminal domain (CTD) phosphatase [Lobosporangium transversale]|uniref:RNA polymerase II subunit A C-terminal domain phosphatase n=1 Tax=Lobosporangium transversale TaxID=64571 RepID=A0A1Y2G9A8_9FUNG|nr:hypothetical protein BCR41DRAFT_382185 [Lobosporangium transversale]KAF9913635.1 Carboxy-terminal domain (CTD) phosphatase [Lobosporangium transversale]ORZ04712.1 hypothetical protein BCR41DRAFT_382185 [Lobosporangium transversale]|eukprot:XP_021876709.1 hypothetical protein BCR41DRAFT_382185 [Lobosporangium transversale]
MPNNHFVHRIPEAHTPATIIAVRTSRGKTHSKGDELIEYEYKETVKGFVDDDTTSEQARRAEIRAAKDGQVEAINVSKGQIIQDEATVLMEYKGCDHETRYTDICAECGKTGLPPEAQVNMTHDATSLSVSRSEAARLEKATVQRLVAEGKLSLIVDLDQTLIHATVGTAIDEWINSQGEMPKDIKMFPLPDSPTPYYIKLRPHLEIFLKEVSRAYELHIYTMGTRNYAAAVANVIDPEGRYFSQRILSRDENSHMTQKSIQRLFPCDDSMVVVIDDRADVWRNSPNLVKVHPYEYFIGTGDINAAHLPKQGTPVKSDSAPSAESAKESIDSLETSKAVPQSTDKSSPDANTSAETKPVVPPNTDIANKAQKPKAPVLDDNDDELKRVSNILMDIHEQFFDVMENHNAGYTKEAPDVKKIITNMKRRVLQGVHLVFSSVIPLGQDPQRADIWRHAQHFGAACSHDIRSSVTHVVAAKPGTAKVNKARQNKKIHIVRPEWLYDSIAKFQKQDESKYLLLGDAGKSTSTATTPQSQAEGGEDTGLDDDSIDDEDQGGISEGMDENHNPLSIDKAVINEHLKAMNWGDLEKEIEDEVGDDLDESEFDSDTSNAQSDASTDGGKSPLVKLKRTRIPRKSGLGTSVTYGDGTNSSSSSDDEGNNHISARDELMLDGLKKVAEGRESEESDGEIDYENGSDSDGDDGNDSQDNGSDIGQPARPKKRRRLSYESKTRGDNDDENGAIHQGGAEADDEGNMDYSRQQPEDEDEDDDVFLSNLENDLEAQLNED